MSKRLLLVMLLLGGMTSYGQVASRTQLGTTRTTDSLNETRPGYALIPAAGKALRALIDSNTVALTRKQPMIGTTSRVVSGTYVATMFQVPGATDAETAQNKIIRAPNGGLEIGGNMRFGTGGLTAGGNVDIKPDGNLLIGTNGNANRSIFGHSDGWSINRGTNTARAGFDIGSTTYLGGDVTMTGSMLIPSVDGRYIGFDGLSAGQTVRLRMGDPTGGIDATSGQPLVFKGYHGTVLQNQSGGTGPGLRVNGLASNRNISEYYDASGTLRGAMSQAGQLTANGGIKFGDGTTMTTAPTGGGSSAILYLMDPAGFASSTYDYVQYDGSLWKRSAGSVETDPIEKNNRYTATQYNGSGSFHYDRQFDGTVYFRWWRNASANNHDRLRAMINSGYTDMKVDSGKYYFDSYAWSGGNFHIVGDLADPKKVQFISRGANALDNAPNTRIFRGWFFYDGVTPGQSFDNITIEGITFINQCTATISNTPTNATGSYGPITYDGANQRNILINRCEFYNRTKTAPTNFAYFKVGANKLQENIRITNSRTDNPDSTRARMFVEIINQEHPGSDKTTCKGIRIDHNFIRGVYYGTSVAGNYEGTLVENNRYGFCRDYGSEFAGSNVNAVFRGNSFFGTMNVLWVSNYHGETGASGGDYAIPDSTGQRFTDNYTMGKVNGGYVEIYGGGKMDFSRNNISIDGGVYLQRMTDKGGVTGGVFASNTIVSTMTNANWLQRTTNLLYLNGVKDLTVRDNTIRRSRTVDGALIQSNDNGVSSVSNLYYNNVLEATKNGTGSAYFGNAGTSGVRVGNINTAGTSVN